MAHQSEDCQRLNRVHHSMELDSLLSLKAENPDVFLFWLPANRSDKDGKSSTNAYEVISSFCGELNDNAVVCVLTTPPDAARIYPFLEETKKLEFKLWVAIKKSDVIEIQEGFLPENQLALLVFTRYKGSLKHTKTRIKYTYCPSCGKTTKDYGGKKHLYHSYGTLISDVWRDISVDVSKDIALLEDRLQDLFGLKPHENLVVLDLHLCQELVPVNNAKEITNPNNNNFETMTTFLTSRLINGDCIESLKQLPDNSVDFCFADPPYNLKKSYSHWDDAMESVEYFRWCDEWLTQMARVLKPGRTLAIINIPQWVVRHYQHLQTILEYQNWIAWDAISSPVRLIMPSHYPILCFSKGQPRMLPGMKKETKSDLMPIGELYCSRPSCLAKRKVGDKEDLTDI